MTVWEFTRRGEHDLTVIVSWALGAFSVLLLFGGYPWHHVHLLFLGGLERRQGMEWGVGGAGGDDHGMGSKQRKLKILWQGLGEGPASEMLAVQPGGPKFRSLAPTWLCMPVFRHCDHGDRRVTGLPLYPNQWVPGLVRGGCLKK